MSVSFNIHVNENPDDPEEYNCGFVTDGRGDVKIFTFPTLPRIGECFSEIELGGEYDDFNYEWEVAEVSYYVVEKNSVEITVAVIPYKPKG